MNVSENETTTKWQLVFPPREIANREYHLAQVNIALALYPLDDPRMADFVSRLDEINALAESSSGFIWRLKSESDNALDIPVTDNSQEIVNLSVWESIDHLFNFTYMSAHKQVLAVRKQWFERLAPSHQVLWWIEAGNEPTLREAMHKLEVLNSEGAGPEAFTFKNRFLADGSACAAKSNG